MFDLDRLIVSIKEHEGLRLFVYKDSLGNETIGWGHLLSRGISNETADKILSEDIQSAIREAEAQPWWGAVSTNDARARAFCELVFNMGIGVVNRFHKALAAASRSDWKTCADEFRNSSWFYEVGSKPGQRGFVTTAMIETGEDSQPLSPEPPSQT